MKINHRGTLRLIIKLLSYIVIVIAGFGATFNVARAASVAASPYMGWTSWSLTTAWYINGYGTSWLTEWEMQVQSNQLKATLQPYGYNYFNLDGTWSSTFDGYGRPAPNPANFPDGIPWLSNIVHNNGQKFGIYWVPGVGTDVYNANPPIYGTAYHVDDIVAQPLQTGDGFGSWHLKIDFTKPGAQQYINSIVNQFASWGVDFLKIDGVCPGSLFNDLSIDDRPDIVAYHNAIQQCGRPMWFTISWDIDPDYSSTWIPNTNARRIDNDVETYTAPSLTGWNQISWRFADAVPWAPKSGGANGWMDLDALDIGNGSMDGLTDTQRQTAMTFWALECSPLYTGDDLYHLDSYGLSLLENRNIIAIDQAGHVARQIQSGGSQVWAADNGDGSRTVGLFNLTASTATVTVNWSSLGLSGPADVFDEWANTDLGNSASNFSASLAPYASRLIKVRPAAAAGLPSGYHSLLSVNSGLDLVVSGASTAAGAKLIQYTNNGSTNGKWQFVSVNGHTAIQNQKSSQYVNIPGPTTTQGAQLVQWTSDSQTNSQWTFSPLGGGQYNIVSVYDGMVIDVAGSSKSNDGIIDQWPSNGGANQKWTIN